MGFFGKFKPNWPLAHINTAQSAILLIAIITMSPMHLSHCKVRQSLRRNYLFAASARRSAS